MSKAFTSTGLLRALALTASAALLAALISVPAGAQKTDQPSLSPQQLKELIANPKTKADHERVAQYYDEQAFNYEAGAKLHQELAAFYQRHPDKERPKTAGSKVTYEHCDSLAKELQMAAEDARGLAAEQRDLAKEARK
jgi:hypothetical protein